MTVAGRDLRDYQFARRARSLVTGRSQLARLCPSASYELGDAAWASGRDDDAISGFSAVIAIAMGPLSPAVISSIFETRLTVPDRSVAPPPADVGASAEVTR